MFNSMSYLIEREGGQKTEQEQELHSRMWDLSETYFQDFMFSWGTENQRSCTIGDDDCSPEKLQDRDFGVYITPDEDQDGDTLNPRCVSTAFFLDKRFYVLIPCSWVDDEDVLLHELIHVHEGLIDRELHQYHEIALLNMYKALKPVIPDLDDKMRDVSYKMSLKGTLAIDPGEHDLLFLLKSLELDMRRGKPLGRIFGYELEEGYWRDWKWMYEGE